MRSLFINRDGNIRSGFKIILFFILYFAIMISLYPIVVVIISLIMAKGNFDLYTKLYSQVEKYLFSSQQGMIISQFVSLLAVLIAVFIMIKASNNKSFRCIGMNSIKGNGKDLFWGLVLGAASMSIIFIILMASNNISLKAPLSQPNFTTNSLWGIVLFLIVSFSEEIMCRGYVQSTLNQMGRPWLSAILSSGMFSLLHLNNPNVKIFGLINIFAVGVLFSYMYIKTKNLWMNIGYHFAWNYFQGNVFGFPVSGTTQSKGIYSIVDFKDNILTGGGFGPEAGILATVIIVLGFFVVNKVTSKASFFIKKS